MSSVVFRSSILLFLLLLFNGGAIALGTLPYFYGGAQTFQICQLTMSTAAFVLTLLLPCFVIVKGGNIFAETVTYVLISLVDITVSILITVRWVNKDLENDYSTVPKTSMILFMIIGVNWAAALATSIGFLLALIDSCSTAIRKTRKGDRRPPNLRNGSLPIQSPPRELRSTPYAQPHTTYSSGRSQQGY